MLILLHFLFSPVLSFTEVEAAAMEKPVICQFYLNKEKALQNQQKRYDKKVQIKSFYPMGNEQGKDAFKRMIKSGTKCNGLIMSGHHLGDFVDEGKKFFLKDMEKLACKKEYKAWFSHVKSLWLLGCNTINDKYLKSLRQGKSPTKINGKLNTGDANTVRLLDKGYNLRTTATLQHSYMASLDEMTPLSSRYLRSFPQTQIYGFTQAAPLNTLENPDIDYIYAHIRKVSDAIKQEDEKRDIKMGVEALLMSSNDYCDEKLEAWETMRNTNTESVENQDYGDVHKLGCSLTQAKDVLKNLNSPKKARELAEQILKDNFYFSKKAKRLAQKVLSNPQDLEKVKKLAQLSILETLEKITKEDKDIQDNSIKYSHLLFNNIYETWQLSQQFKKEDKKFHKSIASILKKNSFSKTLEERVSSKVIGSIRKIDWLVFYKEIHNLDVTKKSGKKLTFLKNQIDSMVTKFKNSGDSQGNQALTLSVIDQLSQYQLLSKNQIKTFLDAKIFSKYDHLTKEEKEENVGLMTFSASLAKHPLLPYTLQMKYKLQNQLNDQALLSQVKKDLTSNKPDATKKIIVQLGAREFFKTNNVEDIHQLAKMVYSKKSGKKPLRKEMRDSLINELTNFLTVHHPHREKKQSEVYLEFMRYPKLQVISLISLCQGLQNNTETKQLFFDKFKVQSHHSKTVKKLAKQCQS